MDFASQSTCTAVVHSGEKSQPITMKITWSVTLVVGTVLTAYHDLLFGQFFHELVGK